MKRVVFLPMLSILLVVLSGFVLVSSEFTVLPGDRPLDSVAPGIAYVKVSDYFESGFSRFGDVIKEIKRKKLNSKIILDFRGLSIMDLENALEVIETFVGPGKIAYIKENKEEVIREEIRTNYPREDINVGEVVCLINADTNMPSEIIVSALKNYLFNVTTVGEKTTGNNDFHRIYPSGIKRLPYGFDWLSSSGNKISGVGITPAYEVIDKEPGRDLVIEKAVEILER